MGCIYIRIFIPYSLFQETSKRFNKNVEAFEAKRRNVFKKHRGLLTSEREYTLIGNLCNKMKDVALCSCSAISKTFYGESKKLGTEERADIEEAVKD